MWWKIKNNVAELAIVVFVLLGAFLFFSRFDVLEKIVEFSAKYEEYEIDEIVSTFLVLAFYLIFFSLRKLREQAKTNEIIAQKNAELSDALDEIKTLQGIIPICMHCKGIRDDEGIWRKMEHYLSEHSGAKFSHGICSECMEKYYPELLEEKTGDS